MSAPQQDILERVAVLNTRLEELKQEFEGEPMLYKIYSQSISYELGLLADKVREAFAAVDTRTDIWISLKGEAFGAGSGPVDIVVNFLNNFRIAAKHTASALMGVAHTGGRFLREIEAATTFDIVATAPGSLQIGLARPQLNIETPPSLELFELTYMSETILKAQEQSELGIKAIQSLLLALEASESENALNTLRHELGDHGTLRVIYHARSLFARGIDQIEFSGNVLGRSSSYSSQTRDKLKALGESLVEAERYVSGVGIVRMLDLDRKSLRLEFTRIESLPGLDTMNAEYDVELEPIAPVMGQAVTFSGSLAFDQRGIPQRLKLDSLDLLDTTNEPSNDPSRLAF